MAYHFRREAGLRALALCRFNRREGCRRNLLASRDDTNETKREIMSGSTSGSDARVARCTRTPKEITETQCPHTQRHINPA